MAEKNSLWKNIRNKAKKNRESGATPKQPTTEMLRQERKIKAKQYAEGSFVGEDENGIPYRLLSMPMEGYEWENRPENHVQESVKKTTSNKLKSKEQSKSSKNWKDDLYLTEQQLQEQMFRKKGTPYNLPKTSEHLQAIGENWFDPNRVNSVGENLIEVVDPTGISSWDDASTSYNSKNPSNLEAISNYGSAIPVLGKIPQAAKSVLRGWNAINGAWDVSKDNFAEGGYYPTQGPPKALFKGYAEGGYTNPYNQYQDDPYLNYAGGGYMYGNGGRTWKNIGAGAYGALEGLVDTTFGYIPGVDIGTDLLYKGLQKVGNSTEDEIREQDSIHGYGQTAGAVGSAILTAGATTPTAIAEGAQGLGQGISKGSETSDVARGVGTGLNIAGGIVGAVYGSTDSAQAAKEGFKLSEAGSQGLGKFAAASPIKGFSAAPKGTMQGVIDGNAVSMKPGTNPALSSVKPTASIGTFSNSNVPNINAPNPVNKIADVTNAISDVPKSQEPPPMAEPVSAPKPPASQPQTDYNQFAVNPPTINTGLSNIDYDFSYSPNTVTFSQGGNITNNSLNLRNTMRYKRFAQGGTLEQQGVNFITEKAGLHYQNANGGVPIGPDALAEGGEAKLQMADGGQYIVSGEVNGANTQSINGETMTQRLKKKLKPFMMGGLASNPKDKDALRRPHDSYSAESIAQAKEESIQETEAVRMQRGGALQYAANGGKLTKDIEKIVMEEYSAAYGGMLPNKYKGKVNMPNSYAKGGIHIKESKKGTFTAAATKHGKSVQEFAQQVLANKENYSPAMVKKANFARNASKWNHADGGYVHNQMTQPMYAEGGPIYGDPASEYVYAYGGMYGNPYARGGQIDYTNDMYSSYAGGGPMVSNVNQPFKGPAAQNRGGMYMTYADGGMMPSEEQIMQQQMMQQQQAPQEQMQQQGGQDQMMQMVQQVIEALMQGANPEQVMQQLVQSGVPPEQAQQIIQVAMQEAQGQQQPQEQPMQEGQQMPFQQSMSTGGRLPKDILRARAEAHMSPEKAAAYVDKYAMGGKMYYEGGVGGPPYTMAPISETTPIGRQTGFWVQTADGYKFVNQEHANQMDFNNQFEFRNQRNQPSIVDQIRQGTMSSMANPYKNMQTANVNTQPETWTSGQPTKSTLTPYTDQNELRDSSDYLKQLTANPAGPTAGPVNMYNQYTNPYPLVGEKEERLAQIESNMNRSLNTNANKPKQFNQPEEPNPNRILRIDEEGNPVYKYEPPKVPAKSVLTPYTDAYTPAGDPNDNSFLYKQDGIPMEGYTPQNAAKVNNQRITTPLSGFKPGINFTQPELDLTQPVEQPLAAQPTPQTFGPVNQEQPTAKSSAAPTQPSYGPNAPIEESEAIRYQGYKPQATTTPVTLQSGVTPPPVTDKELTGINNRPSWVDIGIGASQLAGAAHQFFQKRPEPFKYDKMQATTLNPTPAIVAANQAAREAQALTDYNIKQNAPTSGSYLANIRANALQSAKQRGAAASGIQQQYDIQNAGILNQMEQQNTEIENRNIDAIQQDLANFQEQRTNALYNAGANIAGMRKDYKANEINQIIANNIGTNNWKYDKATNSIVYRTPEGQTVKVPVQAAVAENTQTPAANTPTTQPNAPAKTAASKLNLGWPNPFKPAAPTPGPVKPPTPYTGPMSNYLNNNQIPDFNQPVTASLYDFRDAMYNNDENAPDISEYVQPLDETDTKNIKEFQDWLDLNHPNEWTKSEKPLKKGKGYGNFGDYTQNAWYQFGKEFLGRVPNKYRKNPNPSVIGYPNPNVVSFEI